MNTVYQFNAIQKIHYLELVPLYFSEIYKSIRFMINRHPMHFAYTNCIKMITTHQFEVFLQGLPSPTVTLDALEISTHI